MTAEGKNEKRYGVYAIAITLLVVSAAALVFGGNSFAMRCLGIVACIAAVRFVQISKLRGQPSIHSIGEQGIELHRGPPSVMWVIGAALLAAVLVAGFLLYRDAAEGYKDAFPVYAFAASVVLCGGFWGYLLSRYS